MARLITELGRLPGICEITAERLASHLLLVPRDQALGLARAIQEMREQLRRCSLCGGYAQEEPCPICRDPGRDPRRIVVVEEPRDQVALEEAGVCDGRYHVLGGRLAPLEGVESRDLTLELLARRVAALLAEGPELVELIIATNPNLEGDHTALAVATRLQGLPGHERLVMTRIATGLPSGSAIEYAHREVLVDAFRGRRPLEITSESAP
jgi:recombination protein RecR